MLWQRTPWVSQRDRVGSCVEEPEAMGGREFRLCRGCGAGKENPTSAETGKTQIQCL